MIRFNLLTAVLNRVSDYSKFSLPLFGLVRGETEAIASRVRDEHDPADPFRAPPNAVLWSYVGDLAAAVSEVLDLPAPRERGAPGLARRGPSELWTPNPEFHR